MKLKKFSFKKFILDRQILGSFFLGVGLTMLIIDLIAFGNMCPYISDVHMEYAPCFFAGYWISLLSSLILISYSLYNILIDNK